MKLYIANATKQRVDFMYRVPEQPGVRNQPIDIGSQILISGSDMLNAKQVDSIIEQHTKYGLVNVDEVDRTKAFAGLFYSVDQPISGVKIMRAVQHNTAVLQERGKQIRKEAAITSNQLLENSMTEQEIPGNLKAVELSVVEENHDERDETPALAEGIRVTRNEPESTQPSRAPRGKGRR